MNINMQKEKKDKKGEKKMILKFYFEPKKKHINLNYL